MSIEKESEKTLHEIKDEPINHVLVDSFTLIDFEKAEDEAYARVEALLKEKES